MNAGVAFFRLVKIQVVSRAVLAIQYVQVWIDFRGAREAGTQRSGRENFPFRDIRQLLRSAPLAKKSSTFNKSVSILLKTQGHTTHTTSRHQLPPISAEAADASARRISFDLVRMRLF